MFLVNDFSSSNLSRDGNILVRSQLWNGHSSICMSKCSPRGNDWASRLPGWVSVAARKSLYPFAMFSRESPNFKPQLMATEPEGGASIALQFNFEGPKCTRNVLHRTTPPRSRQSQFPPHANLPPVSPTTCCELKQNFRENKNRRYEDVSYDRIRLLCECRWFLPSMHRATSSQCWKEVTPQHQQIPVETVEAPYIEHWINWERLWERKNRETCEPVFSLAHNLWEGW